MGLILGVGSVAIFILAVGLVCFATVMTFKFGGSAFNPRRRTRSRLIYGAAALASFAGVFLAAGAGFMGITALLYHVAG